MSLKRTESTLCSAVLLNELVLENIFSNLEIKECLGFRKVCKTWKPLIDRKISREFTASFYVDYDAFYSRQRSFRIFNNLKVSRIKLKLPQCRMATDVWEFSTPRFFRLLTAWGSQIEHLSLDGSLCRIRSDWIWMKEILTLLPNLETLIAQCNNNDSAICEVFQDFCHPNLRSINFSIWFEEKDNVAKTLAKCFPNLETNFGVDGFDCDLLKLLNSGEIGSIRLKKFLAPKSNLYKRCRTFRRYGGEVEYLYQLDEKTHPLSILEFVKISEFDENMAKMLAKVFKKFDATLKEVVLAVEPSYDFDMEFPALPKLRKLTVETAASDGNIYFSWEMGVMIAKNFPVLGSLIYNPGISEWSHGGEQDYEFEKDWKLWNPFLPLEEFTQEPFKYLKFVELGIHKKWIGPEENREWGQKVLKAYSVIYGNAWNRDFLQKMTDWLQ